MEVTPLLPHIQILTRMASDFHLINTYKLEPVKKITNSNISELSSELSSKIHNTA